MAAGPSVPVHCSWDLKGAIFKATLAVIVPNHKDLPGLGGWEIGRGQVPASAPPGENKTCSPVWGTGHSYLLGAFDIPFHQLTSILQRDFYYSKPQNGRGDLKPLISPRHLTVLERGFRGGMAFTRPRSAFIMLLHLGDRCSTALYLHNKEWSPR